MQLTLIIPFKRTITSLCFLIFTLLFAQKLCSQSITYGQSNLLDENLPASAIYEVATSAPEDIVFNDDGSKFYYLDGSFTRIYQFSTSTPWDLDGTITSEGNRFFSSVGSVESFQFNPTGDKLYLLSRTNEVIYQYDIETAFDVTSTVTLEGSASVAPDPEGFDISPSGNRVVVAQGGTLDRIRQYNLATPFDFTGTVTGSGTTTVSSIEAFPQDVSFSKDGDRVFVIGTGGDKIHVYSLVSSYTVGSADYEFSVDLGVPSGFGIYFGDGGSRLYVAEGGSVDAITQFDLPQGKFDEVAANDGAVEGSLAIAIEGDTFTSAGSTLTTPDDYSISGEIEGLTPVLTVAADGASASLSFTGNTSLENSTETRIETLDITFTDDAFTVSNAASVSGSDEAVDVLYVFAGNPVITYGNPFDLASAPTLSTSFDVSSEELDGEGVSFGDNGLKMYVIGQSSDDIHQYTLSSAYDLSATVTYDGEFSVFAQDGNPLDMAISPDGTKVVFVSLGEINQYTLTTPFDIVGSASFSENQSISSSSIPTGVSYHPNGTSLFISMAGGIGPEVHQFEIDDFDISTFTKIEEYDASSYNSSLRDVDFSNDGTRMFILGSSPVEITQFRLSEAFDLGSTVSFRRVWDEIDDITQPTSMEFSQ